ncbi:CLUMA_CG008781, isoform A [Clunio marinus]|uniref:CLUMA_CG008781, isoform A n=1 Tax=Clunio marinus TaxID=568069 RepID=A0A1J1IA02_9DIPT|nr:CLUMA_CG008781, isoform A [Clunio marinus]
MSTTEAFLCYFLFKPRPSNLNELFIQNSKAVEQNTKKKSSGRPPTNVHSYSLSLRKEAMLGVALVMKKKLSLFVLLYSACFCLCHDV